MTAIIKQVEQLRANPVFGQMLRYAISGGITTLLYAVVYSPLAKFHIVSPQIANLFGYLVAMGTGYMLHSRWSFRGHGTRDNIARTGGRFFAVSLVSYALNAFFVFVLTDSSMLGGAWWWPLAPVLFVTPLVTFALHRAWAFR